MKNSDRECFDAWSGLNSRTPVTLNGVKNQIIWNARYVCIDKKNVYINGLVNLGIIKASDLITDNNLFLREDPFFFIMEVVHALPSDWKTIIRSSLCKSKIRPSPNTPYLKLNCGSFPISDVTSKPIYDSVLCRKTNSPGSLAKYNRKILISLFSFPYYNYSKLREFQNKILSNIVFTNDIIGFYQLG